MSYPNFLLCHSKLHHKINDQQWNGCIYLPPCSCSSQTCPYVSVTTTFDFEKHVNLKVSDLTELCQYVNPTATSSSKISYILCKKYSLQKETIDNTLNQHNSHKDKLKSIVASSDFRNKTELLKADLSVLYPLTGSKFRFLRKIDKSIKFHVACHMHFTYDSRCKNATPHITNRNCTTSKPLNKDHIFPFLINIHLNHNTGD